MVKFFIADRRDLLAGRLLPILNGLRLSNRLGAIFLTTWFTGKDPFQSLVAALPEILSGPFLQPFPLGCRIEVSDERLIAGNREVITRPCGEAGMAGISDFLV